LAYFSSQLFAIDIMLDDKEERKLDVDNFRKEEHMGQKR
jgi:hypothetical protein